MWASTPRVIVLERAGIWAAGLRRHLPAELRLRETRSPEECLAELGQAPRSLVALEVPENGVDGMLDLLGAATRRFPMARFVALAERGLEAHEWLLREAGAVHFTTSPREIDVVARLAERHAARLPQPRTTFAAQIWESLPWPSAARE